MGRMTSVGQPFITVPTLPVGVPFPWFTEELPSGTMLLDGSTFSAIDYPDLASVYPSFTLPDMRGVVPRGMDVGRGLNPDASGLAVGSYQGDGIKSHTHTTFTEGGAGSVGSGGILSKSLSLPSGATGGTETRGKAILCYWICYARPMYYDMSIEGANAYLLGGHPANYYASKQGVLNTINSQFNVTGDAPKYACRAWGNFNGQGVIAIRASGNISSIVDNGVGDYSINFSSPMPDANYTVAVNYSAIFGTHYVAGAWLHTSASLAEVVPTVNGFRFVTGFITGNNMDAKYVNFAVFR